MKPPLRLAALGGLAAAIAALQPYRLAVVDGASMSPTYRSLEPLLVRRVDSPLRRGDVVVFRHGGETLVKRVALVAGDTYTQMLAFGEWVLPSNALMLAAARKGMRHPLRTLAVPPGELYVVGDNLCGSVDSRVFGPVPLADVVGRAVDARSPQGGSLFFGEGGRVAMR